MGLDTAQFSSALLVDELCSHVNAFTSSLVVTKLFRYIAWAVANLFINYVTLPTKCSDFFYVKDKVCVV